MKNTTSIMAIVACIFGTSALAAEENNKSETIVVHGKKQDSATNGALGKKAIIDTPFSISVVSNEDIEARGANSIGQIFINDPGVTNLEASATTSWWGIQIRGIGVRKHYIDNAEMALYWGGEFPNEPIEQVTALKGLSGFMHGFSSPGGVISYNTKRPKDINTTSITLRNPTQLEIHHDIGGKVGNLGYRINGVIEGGEAYNTSKIDRKLLSAAFDYDIGEKLQLNSRIIYEDKNLKEEPLQIYIASSSGLPMPTFDYDDITVDGSYYRTKTLFTSGGINYDFNDDWNLNLSHSYTRKKHESNKTFAYLLNSDGDYSGNIYQFYDTLETNFSQILVNGKLKTGAIKHELVFGSSLQSDYDNWENSIWSNSFNGNIFVNQTYRMPPIANFPKAKSNQITKQIGVFASDTIHFNDKFQAILGLRYSDYENVQSGYKTQPISPSVAVIYKPKNNFSIYASIVEGLEEGTKVSEEYANSGEFLDATTSKQVETGIKYESRKFNGNLAIFNLERAAQISEVKDAKLYLTQNGKSIYKGIELSTNLQTSDNLRIGYGLIYIDAKFDKMSEANKAWEGQTPWGVNKWQHVANIEYIFPKVSGLSFHANYRYYGQVRAGIDYGVTEWGNFSGLFLSPHQIVNAGFEYKAKQFGKDIAYNFNANNIFSEKYWAHNGIGEAANLTISAKISW